MTVAEKRAAAYRDVIALACLGTTEEYLAAKDAYQYWSKIEEDCKQNAASK